MRNALLRTVASPELDEEPDIWARNKTILKISRLIWA